MATLKVIVGVLLYLSLFSPSSSSPLPMAAASIPATTPAAPLTVLIIGGGLSGLTIAHELSRSLQQQQQQSNATSSKWHLIESQNYLGGRIKNDTTTNRIDVGGAWIWPSQRRIHALVRDLKLRTISQEDADDGRVRIQNGAASIIDGLAASLSRDCVTLSVAVTHVERMGDHLIKVTIHHSNDSIHPQQQVMYTKYLVWAAPPRMALSPRIQWNPPLSNAKIIAQQNSNTWMASVTKLSFIYNSKYWDTDWILEMKRGIYFHRNGEAFDLYDACIEESSNDDDGNNVYAFTLFALVDWTEQKDHEAIAQRVMSQLLSIASSSRMISQSTRNPPATQWMTQYKSYAIHHWPHVSSISDDSTPTSVGQHPRPNPTLSQSEWDAKDNMKMVYFAGTESDLYSPGLMEGAIGSAYRVVEELRNCLW